MVRPLNAAMVCSTQADSFRVSVWMVTYEHSRRGGCRDLGIGVTGEEEVQGRGCCAHVHTTKKEFILRRLNIVKGEDAVSHVHNKERSHAASTKGTKDHNMPECPAHQQHAWNAMAHKPRGARSRDASLIKMQPSWMPCSSATLRSGAPSLCCTSNHSLPGCRACQRPQDSCRSQPALCPNPRAASVQSHPL